MPRNIPLFIAFRLLFNARFYYPIFAVLQLDYGLTMAQFAILNAVWAASIVLLEVPSGALADKLGRKPMVVIASVLMILEMGLIAFVPLGNASIVFWVWVLNRILSGAAEASASGADEALAYDSLPEGQQEKQWPKVLARLMTFSSFAFVIAMLLGGALYDAEFLNRILGTDLAKETVIRFPVYLTLLSALITLPVALMMKEPETQSEEAEEELGATFWGSIWKTGHWILGTPLVFALILAALVHDTLVRLFLTMNSEYYRLIDLPESSFGVIGAGFAALGMIVPKIAQRMVEGHKMATNYLWVSLLTVVGLFLVAQAWQYYGVIVVIFFSAGFGLLNFFSSHYLNAQVSSRRRATVLSFKGLALNIGFGVTSVLYAVLLSGLNDDFKASLAWLAPSFLVMLVPLLIYYRLKVIPVEKEA
ncbi:MFS transporter [Akkermansiaceae bacterium]|nr:MFS transporter [Akkermansiaceae bacterium]MDB4328723.1 MFS transporter [Akkermansiaceae bacterium]MDB4630401.1 MFS transporter [Akkermansiaceae bacterium]